MRDTIHFTSYNIVHSDPGGVDELVDKVAEIEDLVEDVVQLAEGTNVNQLYYKCSFTTKRLLIG